MNELVPIGHQHMLAKLSAMGLNARFRRWAAGETGLVKSEPYLATPNLGIRVSKRVAHLIPTAPDRWKVDIGISDDQTRSADEVVRFVARLITEPEAYDAEFERRSRRVVDES
jgi:hypothetical protein